MKPIPRNLRFLCGLSLSNYRRMPYMGQTNSWTDRRTESCITRSRVQGIWQTTCKTAVDLTDTRCWSVYKHCRVDPRKRTSWRLAEWMIWSPWRPGYTRMPVSLTCLASLFIAVSDYVTSWVTANNARKIDTTAHSLLLPALSL